jgi:hypothetical protein
MLVPSLWMSALCGEGSAVGDSSKYEGKMIRGATAHHLRRAALHSLFGLALIPIQLQYIMGTAELPHSTSML